MQLSFRQRTAPLAIVALLALAACSSNVSGGGSGGDDTTTNTNTNTGSDGSTGVGGSTKSGCVVGGCSGQICAEGDGPIGSTCEWTDVYACYQALGVCERDAMGQCGWKQTPELVACVDAGGRLPASGQCVRNAGDACASDFDCQVGGCGGELCYSPAKSSGISTCDCTTPTGPSCGCVDGVCQWWNAP